MTFDLFTQKLDWPEDTPAPAMLSEEERARHGRFRFARDRARFAQSHVFLRETLSRFANVDPKDWQFEYGEYGKPSIASPAGLDLDFNLSHSKHWAACVVTHGVPCGIDIEYARPISHMLDIAQSRFAPEEFRELEQLGEPALTRRFFELWTEKEAWMKALGQGMTLGLDCVISNLPGVELYRLEPPTDHALAVVLLNR
jgi:4'-phosphopantetheinyl transferase